MYVLPSAESKQIYIFINILNAQNFSYLMNKNAH